MTDYDGKDRPEHYELPDGDERTELRNGIVRALYALPMHFTSPINVEGIEVNDLFSINTLLGGTIEAQTVMLLNSLRSIWDPQGKWADKEFRRYPESFPDVRLVGSNKDDSPLIGIELKGWYLLSKESEPSLRYKASADAVTEWDLICCVPWGLSNVLCGKPVVYEPYVEQAKFASDIWQIHPFGEGNTRATAVFMIKYMKTFGFRVKNDAFEKNSWYFRNALVRANYTNLQKGVHSTTKFLEMFFGNLLLGTDYELKNRYMHIDYVDVDKPQSAKQQIPKCQFGTLDCTLEELAVLDLIKKNPTIKQQELADITGKSIRSVKRIMKSLQDKSYIRRERGKRYGKWEVLV